VLQEREPANCEGVAQFMKTSEAISTSPSAASHGRSRRARALIA
jgi:hypothetical protein